MSNGPFCTESLPYPQHATARPLSPVGSRTGTLPFWGAWFVRRPSNASPEWSRLEHGLPTSGSFPRRIPRQANRDQDCWERTHRPRIPASNWCGACSIDRSAGPAHEIKAGWLSPAGHEVGGKESLTVQRDRFYVVSASIRSTRGLTTNTSWFPRFKCTARPS